MAGKTDRKASITMRIGLILLAVLFMAATPAHAQDAEVPDLERVARAVDEGDVAMLRAASRDLPLLQQLRDADPEAFIAFQLALAQAYREAGLIDDAAGAYRLALQVIREVRGADDLSLADPLVDLARLQTDPAERLDGLEQAYLIREAVLGAAHPTLVAYRSELDAVRLEANRNLASRGLEGTPAPPPAPTEVPVVAEADRNFRLIDVFWATHRAATGNPAPGEAFGGQAGPLIFGVSEVSVPRDRAVGSLPLPFSFLTLEFRPDPNRHMILNSVTPIGDRETFMATIAGRVDSSTRKEVFVFIHGYNTTFEWAALRTAQLAVDMNLDGAPVLYSWPSRASLLAYAADTRTVGDPALLDDVAGFLTELAQRSGAERIHLVAHSMGTRVLLRSLDRIAAARQGQPRLFDEVVLAAADVGVEEFETTWPRVLPTAERFTLYASRRDRALQISAMVNRMRRIGDAREVVVQPGLDTVDTTNASSGLLGHEDFAGSALADFQGVVWLSLAPDRRCVLQTAGPAEARFWNFGSGCPEAEFVTAAERVRTSGSYPLALSSLESELPAAPPERRSLLERARDRLRGMFAARR
jgi:esterase/lipase superfamily enzyme